MEFWLKKDNESKFMFPVNPTDFSVSVTHKNTVVNVVTVGDVNLVGKTGLREVVIASFFPDKDYNFSMNDSRKEPTDYVDLIERWRKAGEPVRIIITGAGLNMECTIESFAFGEQDGTGDIYFTLNLKEYKKINTKKANVKITTVKPSTRATQPPASGKSYTVKRGDCLWNIAKQFYGDGSKYPQIYSANKATIDGRNKGTGLPQYTIYSGQVFNIP